ncbi:phage portal protein, partial [Escherichia coli]
MAILDDVIGVFSPGWKAARLRSRAVIQAYEAVKTTRTHKARRENRTADQLSQYGAVSLREQARYLDNNHDLVIGVFDKLEERVVGKNGIIVEPHPVLRNGAIARDLAAEIRTRWSEWSVSPEVTGQFTRPMLERLMLRTWLRDGEVFAQMVSGRINSLTPSAGVHFWLEALEPDFIPMTSDESNRLNQGVFVDDWGRPEKYLVYKSRPVSGRQMETKEVDAERMLHLKFVRRLHQMRGTSLLSGVLIRLSALKDYEDYELTAARIAAALGMYIRKGDGQSYEPDGNGSKDKERELTIQPGIIYDDLKPGEEIGMVKSDRPNPNLETFRNGQLRAVAADGSERLVSTARTTETTYRFRQLALGNYRLTVRAVNAWGQQGDPASVSFRIAAPAAPSRIELTPGYFQITATPHLAVYDPTVQFEFWFSEKRIADIRQVETSARYLGTALYWIAASINIKPGHDYYFYVRSVNTVGKSAFVEAVGQPSDDASGYLDFFKGEIGKTHLAQELWTQIDNGQLAPDLTEIRTSITDVSNEITQTVNKKLEDQSAAIQQIQKVQVDTNNNLNSMWAVKLQQMQDGRLYIA